MGIAASPFSLPRDCRISSKPEKIFEVHRIIASTRRNAKIPVRVSLHCNSRNCSQAAKKFQPKKSESPLPLFSFSPLRVDRRDALSHFGCGFAALCSSRLCGSDAWFVLVVASLRCPVSRVSSPAGRTTRHTLPIWKSAKPQVWKPAPRRVRSLAEARG